MPFEIRLEKEPLAPSHPYHLASIALQVDAPADTIKTNLKPLQQIYPFENWYAEQSVQRARHEKLSYKYNDTILFAHAAFDQKHIAEDLREIYKNIVQLLTSKHYVLLRAWHYLPRLSEASDYQTFCDARAQAFSAINSDCYCAATVIGTDSDCGVVYFIAAREAGIIVNNPRQTLPYLYPKHYVEPAPMFTRAILKRWKNNSHLYISGTAAIVGHKSMHRGDVGAQFNEVVYNLNTLLNEASKTEQGYSETQPHQLQHVKMYIAPRMADDIVSLIDKHLDAKQLQIYEGQMCRPELLVEIEAIAVADYPPINDA